MPTSLAARGDFGSESVELIHHGVDSVLQFQNFPAHVHRDFSREIAVGHSGGHGGDVANLRRKVTGHRIDAVRQILPHAADAFDFRLAAEFAFRTYFAGYARDSSDANAFNSRSTIVFMVFSRVRVISPCTSTVILRVIEISIGDRRGHFSNIADLSGKIAGHRIDTVSQVFPHAAHALNLRLASQLSFRTDFPRHPGNFGTEAVELIHHGVDRVLQLQNFAARIHGDLRREIAFGNSCSDARDVAHLSGQVARHGIHAFGEIFPGSGYALDFRLASQFAVGSHLTGHTRDFRSE